MPLEPGQTRAPDDVGSILFLRPLERAAAAERTEPPSFADLNLDQVVRAITRAHGGDVPVAVFYSPLIDEDAVAFRQEVFRDLDAPAARAAIRGFLGEMRSVTGLLAHGLDHRYQRDSWFFEAADRYARCVTELGAALDAFEPRSRGLAAFKAHLSAYVGSVGFRSMVAEAAAVRDALAEVRYNLRIGERRVTVSRADPGPDLTAEIEATFDRFRRGAARDYRTTFSADPELTHVGILDRIALLYPEAFRALDEFCERRRDFVDRTIAAFEREVHFYLAYLDFIDQLRAGGLPFCYPRVSERTDHLSIQGGFDIALAAKLVARGMPIVLNDVRLDRPERVTVVTGPNQGGKTTFARAFGQTHYLASLGCPVPGREAQLVLADRLFTHFGREERLADLRGRLEDDLVRMRAILDEATSQSVVILNEVFTSTTLRDAVFLSTEVLGRIEALDLVCVWVTFIDEISALGDQTVSMVSNVLPDDPTVRTFKITRRPADGRAYATALAARYGVSYERLKERLPA